MNVDIGGGKNVGIIFFVKHSRIKGNSFFIIEMGLKDEISGTKENDINSGSPYSSLTPIMILVNV